ncbi:MAG: NYN domain-containing protein [Planctomycetota bacterium]
METSDFGANIFDDPNRGLGDEPNDGKKAPRKRAARKKKSGKSAAVDEGDPPDGPTDSPPTTPLESISAAVRSDGAEKDLEIPSAWQPRSGSPGEATEDPDRPPQPGEGRGARKRRRRRSPTVETGETRWDQEDDSPDFGAEPAARSLDEAIADADELASRAVGEAETADEDGLVEDLAGDLTDGDSAEASDGESNRDSERQGRRRRRRRRGRRAEFDRDEGDRAEAPDPARTEAPPVQNEQRRRPDDRTAASPAREPRHSAGQAEGRVHPRHGREDDEVRSGMPVRQPTRGPIDVPTADSEAQGSRLAILIDLEHVESAAQDRDREVAWGRLVAALGRRRHLIRCLAYAAPERARAMGSRLAGNGIEVVATSEDDRAITVAVDAVNLSQRVDAVMLVPALSSFGPVARALAARGVRIESADFGPSTEAVTAWPHRSIGDECLFVP